MVFIYGLSTRDCKKKMHIKHATDFIGIDDCNVNRTEEHSVDHVCVAESDFDRMIFALYGLYGHRDVFVREGYITAGLEGGSEREFFCFILVLQRDILPNDGQRRAFKKRKPIKPANTDLRTKKYMHSNRSRQSTNHTSSHFAMDMEKIKRNASTCFSSAN